MTKGNLASVRRALRGALAGLLAAGVALGVAELVAGVTGPLSSPVIAVGGVAINLTPVPLKDFAIAHFGSNDKNVLLLGIVVQLALFAVVIGALAVRWLVAGLAGLALFGALGVSAVESRPSAGPADALPTLVGVAVAAVAMTFLIRAARIEPRRRAALRGAGSGADLLPTDLLPPDLVGTVPATSRPGRRRFLAMAPGRPWLPSRRAGRANCCFAGST